MLTPYGLTAAGAMLLLLLLTGLSCRRKGIPYRTFTPSAHCRCRWHSCFRG